MLLGSSPPSSQSGGSGRSLMRGHGPPQPLRRMDHHFDRQPPPPIKLAPMSPPSAAAARVVAPSGLLLRRPHPQSPPQPPSSSSTWAASGSAAGGRGPAGGRGQQEKQLQQAPVQPLSMSEVRVFRKLGLMNGRGGLKFLFSVSDFALPEDEGFINTYSHDNTPSIPMQAERRREQRAAEKKKRGPRTKGVLYARKPEGGFVLVGDGGNGAGGKEGRTILHSQQQSGGPTAVAAPPLPVVIPVSLAEALAAMSGK